MKPYTFTTKVSPDVEKQLKAEQARRVLRNQKKPTIPGLAAELIEKALSELK